MKRPKLIFTTITGVLLLLGSSYFLATTFSITLRGATQFSKFPVQSELSVAVECFSDEISIIPGVSISQSDPVLWVSFSISSANINGCQSVSIFSQRFSFEEATFYSGQMNDPFGYLQSQPDGDAFSVRDQSDDGYGTNGITFELRHGQVDNRAFAIRVPLNDLMTQTDVDSWALDLQINVENSNGQLRGWPHFSFIVDEELSIVDTNVEPIVQIEAEEIRVYRANLEQVSTENSTKSTARFRLEVNDRDGKVWRDISIFLASSIFGASISVLIECFLSLELYRIFARQQVSDSVNFRSMRHQKPEISVERND
jgi:hypothetical protein